MKNKDIKIIDWAGNLLFEGPCNCPEVDKVLDENRCKECKDGQNMTYCLACGDTGYVGDFHIEWVDVENQENVYEYVNY